MKKFLVLTLAAGLCAPLLLSGQEKKTQDPEAQFKRLDKDNNNKLSKDEFLANIQDAEKKTKRENRFKAMDKDNDGFLSLTEYKDGMTKKK